uniref:Uncharacterized protein n=1 Tax=Parascaris univalens TaxID=6257 RepID=A0A914ZUX5_PARUN
MFLHQYSTLSLNWTLRLRIVPATQMQCGERFLLVKRDEAIGCTWLRSGCVLATELATFDEGSGCERCTASRLLSITGHRKSNILNYSIGWHHLDEREGALLFRLQEFSIRSSYVRLETAVEADSLNGKRTV